MRLLFLKVIGAPYIPGSGRFVFAVAAATPAACSCFGGRAAEPPGRMARTKIGDFDNFGPFQPSRAFLKLFDHFGTFPHVFARFWNVLDLGLSLETTPGARYCRSQV